MKRHLVPVHSYEANLRFLSENRYMKTWDWHLTSSIHTLNHLKAGFDSDTVNTFIPLGCDVWYGRCCIALFVGVGHILWQWWYPIIRVVRGDWYCHREHGPVHENLRFRHLRRSTIQFRNTRTLTVHMVVSWTRCLNNLSAGFVTMHTTIHPPAAFPRVRNRNHRMTGIDDVTGHEETGMTPTRNVEAQIEPLPVGGLPTDGEGTDLNRTERPMSQVIV